MTPGQFAAQVEKYRAAVASAPAIPLTRKERRILDARDLTRYTGTIGPDGRPIPPSFTLADIDATAAALGLTRVDHGTHDHLQPARHPSAAGRRRPRR